MNISADILRVHLGYTAWASARIVAAASQLTPEELTRDFQTADRSVLGTLVHCFAADRIWLDRVLGEASPRSFDVERDMKLEVIQTDWPALMEGWKQWAAGLSDESAQATCAYRDRRGNAGESPVWQIVMHVVNHGTHHRGQASGFLRTMGRVPPPLDLLAYYRQLAVAQ